MPEPMITQDGTEKNDCERHAAKRFIMKLRQDHLEKAVLTVRIPKIAVEKSDVRRLKIN